MSDGTGFIVYILRDANKRRSIMGTRTPSQPKKRRRMNSNSFTVVASGIDSHLMVSESAGMKLIELHILGAHDVTPLRVIPREQFLNNETIKDWCIGLHGKFWV